MKYLLLLLITLSIVLMLTVLVQAQPMLPSAPDQAPIDGGTLGGLTCSCWWCVCMEEVEEFKELVVPCLIQKRREGFMKLSRRF